MGKALAAWIMVAAVVAARPATRPREVVESAVKRVIVALQEANRGHAEADRAGRPYDLERQHTEIKRIAAGLFDFDEAARGTLSRHWSARTPEERTEFVRLFTQLLERSYLEKIDSYSGPMSRGFTRDSRNAREMCQRDSYQVCLTSV